MTTRQISIAMIGTRGVPARYGGFETAVEEIGSRLVERGHRVVVYCRSHEKDEPGGTYLGMERVTLPAMRRRSLETLSHTSLSVGHLVAHRVDAAFVFNAANAPLLPTIRLAGVPVATHVDGLEWRRAKWGASGQRYYKMAEQLAVRWSDALIADAPGIARYYRDEFDAETRLLSYGAPLLDGLGDDRLGELGLRAGSYHLVVARFEPENHVHLAVQGYVASRARLPLVVVGSAPYSDDYTALVTQAAGDDPRVRMLGGVWDKELLDQLYAHAVTYVHGHSVGGTNPSLLRAIGASTATVAFDVPFNRDILGSDGLYFSDAAGVAAQIEAAEADPAGTQGRGRRLRARAATYTWEDVTSGYEQLAQDLVAHRVPGPQRARRATRPEGEDRAEVALGAARG